MKPQFGNAPLNRLVEWALGPDALRPIDTGHAITVVTDTIAAIIAASVEDEVAGFAEVAATERGSSTILATGAKTSAFWAACANGLAAVRLELDEGNQFAGNHPSAHTLPALFATAEQRGNTGLELLQASAAAYEVAVRVARGMHLRRPVHPFGTAMACGSAVGVSRLRKLDVATTVRAVLIAAALTPASTQRAANNGATVRNAITGVSAANGILATDLAVSGTTADDRALETVFGEILGDSYDVSRLDSQLGDERFLTRNYFKLHACSRWNHAPIEATETLLREHAIGPRDIVAIRVATYDPAIRLNGHDVRTGFAGKHSIPYSVAARVVFRSNGIESYTDAAAADPRVRRLMQSVEVVEDGDLTRLAPEIRAARVTIRTTDGRDLTALEDRPPGGFDRPYSPAVLAEKHRAMLDRGLQDNQVDAVLAWCAGLSDARDVTSLADILGGPS